MTSHGASLARVGPLTASRTDSTAKPTRCVRRAVPTHASRGDNAPSTSSSLPAPSRRALLAGLTAAGLALSADAEPATAAELLSKRLERKDFSKPVFNASRPKAQTYPEWLEG